MAKVTYNFGADNAYPVEREGSAKVIIDAVMAELRGDEPTVISIREGCLIVNPSNVNYVTVKER